MCRPLAPHTNAQIKARLGNALLSLGEEADKPTEQRMMLEESEALLLSAVYLGPGDPVQNGA